jgi:hypothetical protein
MRPPTPPLPTDMWEAIVSRLTGAAFYFNRTTGVAQYERPSALMTDDDEDTGQHYVDESGSDRTRRAPVNGAAAAAPPRGRQRHRTHAGLGRGAGRRYNSDVLHGLMELDSDAAASSSHY